jgi:hypothetical protein
MGIRERLLLFQSGLLPKEGDFTTLKALRVLKEELSIDQEEQTNVEFKTENGMHLWNPDKEVEIDIEIIDDIDKAIRDELTKLNKDKKLPEGLFDLYLFFFPEE